MKYLTIILILILVQTVHATCSENQIDINSASLKELDKLRWVGPTTAQNIIDARPFESVDNLINIPRITADRLNEIKEEGLACVEKTEDKSKKEKDSDKDDEENDKKSNEKDKEDKKETDSKKSKEEDSSSDEDDKDLVSFDEKKKEFVEEKQIKEIKLNSKDIKTKNSLENEEPEKNFAIYGLLSFCVLLTILFSIKKLKLQNYKNEFD